MKFKNLLIAAVFAICVQMAPPALAAPKGDWIDVSSLTPVYTAENQAVTANGAIEADVNVTDFIVDFEVAMSGRYVIKRNGNNFIVSNNVCSNMCKISCIYISFLYSPTF